MCSNSPRGRSLTAAEFTGSTVATAPGYDGGQGTGSGVRTFAVIRGTSRAVGHALAERRTWPPTANLDGPDRRIPVHSRSRWRNRAGEGTGHQHDHYSSH